jgi:hypothetical protein
MEIMEFIDLKTQELESLKKDQGSLYIQRDGFRRLKDRENKREITKKIEKMQSSISKINIEIGTAYEKQALSLNSEEKLPILLRALEYYKLSSYKDSIRILKEAKQNALKINNIALINLCEAQIIIMECKDLDNRAEELWSEVTRSNINEQDNKCPKLSIQRDIIVKKLKDGLQYAQESNSSEILIDFYLKMTWNLYRRCDRSKFLNEIEMYHIKAAVVFECLAWKSYPANKEDSRKYLNQASFQYLLASLDSDIDRINEILVNAFNMSDFDYFMLKVDYVKTIEDIENLEIKVNKRDFDKKDYIINRLKSRKAILYKTLATEDIDDTTSFFIAAQYFEECHKQNHGDSEMGSDMGDSLFLKARGNLRLAIHDGILTINGKKHLNLAIEQIKKSISVSDWAFIEPTYLSICETINNFICQSINDLNHKKIVEILSSAKFMRGQENFQKEKTILIHMEKLFESIISDDRISALNCIKNIDLVICTKIGNKSNTEIDFEKFGKMQLNKEQFIEAWGKCIVESDKNKKGKLLEQFTVSLFSTIKGFMHVDSNVSTVNEEFDAIFRNDIDRPFLQALNSPLIIFECKNWSKKVSIGEVKAFYADLADHQNLVKVGIFISVNGFEAGCRVQQTRLSGSNKILILVTGEDIEKFLNSKKDTLEWLEDLISTAFK